MNPVAIGNISTVALIQLFGHSLTSKFKEIENL
ncbi:MAG: Uncharacterised protein [Polaribacter sejongensis]|nr:MAG: Uncharacterised protein [Polaribacter sejongensis]